jgi:hypothetical protein
MGRSAPGTGGNSMMYGPDMMVWSVWHSIIFVIFAALVLYPIGRILRRIGFSPVWSVLAFVPIVNLIGLWVLALSNWPRSDDG